MEEKMIQLNHRPYPYQEGMTIGSLMKENNFVFSHIIVKINGALIDEEQWAMAPVSPGDKVELIHVFGGG